MSKLRIIIGMAAITAAIAEVSASEDPSWRFTGFHSAPGPDDEPILTAILSQPEGAGYQGRIIGGTVLTGEDPELAEDEINAYLAENPGSKLAHFAVVYQPTYKEIPLPEEIATSGETKEEGEQEPEEGAAPEESQSQSLAYFECQPRVLYHALILHH